MAGDLVNILVLPSHYYEKNIYITTHHALDCFANTVYKLSKVFPHILNSDYKSEFIINE